MNRSRRVDERLDKHTRMDQHYFRRKAREAMEEGKADDGYELPCVPDNGPPKGGRGVEMSRRASRETIEVDLLQHEVLGCSHTRGEGRTVFPRSARDDAINIGVGR